MSIRAIGRLIEEAAERACHAGVPRPAVTSILMRAEAELLNALCTEHGKFVSACGAIGTAILAERYGVTPRAIRKKRQIAKTELKHRTLVPQI